jgi:hypothetical protein
MTKYDYRHGKRFAVKTILPPGQQPRRKRKDTFVQVPLAQAAAIAKATKTTKAMVWLAVLYEVWANKGRPFVLSNQKLAGYGVSRYKKCRVLADMVRAELITLQQNGKGAPVVTWVGR